MRKYFLLIVATSACFTFVISCNNSSTKSETAPLDTASARGLSVQFIDNAVKPGDNFFMFANGKWYDTATILPTESRAGARIEMDVVAKADIKSILEETAAAKSTAGTIEQKVGDLYAAGMDTARIEKLGYDPIKPILQQIDTIKDTKGLLQFVAQQTTENNGSLIGVYVAADDKNSSQNMLALYQSGIGLPDRDYYFKTDAATQTVVNSYKNYIQTLFKLTGDDSAAAARKTTVVYNLEKQLAESHSTNVELRNVQANYNKIAVADLDKKMPGIGWSSLLTDMHLKTDSLNIGQADKYYSTLNGLLKTIKLDTWKTYLRVHAISNAAFALSSPFVNASFEYNDKTLSGQKLMKPRWEIIYNVIDGTIGEALGEIYVKKYFSDAAKKKMLELVNNLQKAFEIRINKLDWMGDSSKQKAIAKLHSFTKKIAFPDKWRDYSNVTINRDDFYASIVSASKNAYQYNANKIGKPVDRTEWGMTPQTNNAYNNPTLNEIVFPAGILQYPMFDINSDDALNYGGIGMVIGHEMTHGFDDQGAQYDKDGNLKNWWSKEDLEKFKAKEDLVIKLYSSFTVLDSMHINGRLTQGENTADIGGICIAYDAFKMTKQGQDTVKLQGYTPDQRFFLSFAQTWRKKITDEAMRQQVNTDPHSPGLYRVIGPLMNFTPFYNAFNVKEGDKYFVAEKDRIHIW